MLNGYLTANAPFERISIDLFGPIDVENFYKNSDSCKFTLLAIIDVLSKWIKIIPLTCLTSNKVIIAIRNEWIAENGCTSSLITDQGRQFSSQEFSDFVKQNSITHIMSSPYNPTGSSVFERANRVIEESLRCLRDKTFLEAIKRTEEAMQHTYHFPLDETLYQVVYGDHPYNPLIHKHPTLKQITTQKQRLATKDLIKRNRNRFKYTYRRSQHVLLQTL